MKQIIGLQTLQRAKYKGEFLIVSQRLNIVNQCFLRQRQKTPMKLKNSWAIISFIAATSLTD